MSGLTVDGNIRSGAQGRVATAFSGSTGDKSSHRKKNPDEIFQEKKTTFGIASASVAGGLVATALGGAYLKGKEFPSQMLGTLGDLFGSGAALLAPFMETKNERDNCAIGRGEKKASFDFTLKAFYRLCSHGLIPYIFERYLNPENWTKSIFHKAAMVINTPFTLFSGYSWAFGNTQAGIALKLLHNAEKEVSTSEGAEKEQKQIEAASYKKIYSSAERLLTLGSIANPVMPCMIYAADACHSITQIFRGENSLGEFFEKPLLGVSKLLSLGIALPEAFAKGIDSFMRVCVNERDHLKPVLPNFAYNIIESIGKSVDAKISTTGTNWLKTLKNEAEMIFHTLSPFAMISLFIPMIDRDHVDENIQDLGGASAFLDRTLGKIAKTLSITFTGFYVFFGRLPQGLIQSAYFGRKLYGKYILGESENQTREKLLALRNKLYNNPLIEAISKGSKAASETLVEGFHDEDIYHDYGSPKYDHILAKYGFDQAQEKYTTLIHALKLLSIENPDVMEEQKLEILSAHNYNQTKEEYKQKHGIDLDKIIEEFSLKNNSQEDKVREIISNFALDHAEKEAVQGNLELTSEEKISILTHINRKINAALRPNDPSLNKVLKPKFPGALFLSRVFLSSLDFQSRIVNWEHEKKLKLEIYEADEKAKAFNNELEVVIAENADGLRRTVNRISSLFHHFALGA